MMIEGDMSESTTTLYSDVRSPIFRMTFSVIRAEWLAYKLDIPGANQRTTLAQKSGMSEPGVS